VQCIAFRTSFRAVAEAAQKCASIEGSGSSYMTPSYALKSGGLIRRLAEIKQGQALERGDAETVELCVQLLKLCDINWKNGVSSIVLRNLSDRKWCGVLYLPLTEDVVKLNQHLVSEAHRATDIVNTDAFMDLTQVTLAKAILFNWKRQGEISKMTVEDYKKKDKADSSHEMMHAPTVACFFLRCYITNTVNCLNIQPRSVKRRWFNSGCFHSLRAHSLTVEHFTDLTVMQYSSL